MCLEQDVKESDVVAVSRRLHTNCPVVNLFALAGVWKETAEQNAAQSHSYL